MLTFNPGDVFGQLEIQAFLGCGLHGEVFAARHLHTDETFALKVTHLSDRHNANAVRRALMAARGTYAVDHANVVKVYDLGCEDDGMVWIRMELLQGCTISALLAWQGRLSPKMALSVAYEAAWALAATHEAQIVHRDVKPSNLFLVDLGSRTTIKLLDFSVAKVLPFSLATTIGRHGLGSPGYVPGEQIYGAPAHPCFDVYGLGMTLWHMLAGFHPWQADLDDMGAIIQRHLRDMPPSLADVAGLPGPIDDLVRGALLKDPAARYPSMTAFARAIDGARAWLAAEEQAGRIRISSVRGEPAPPSGARVRAYAAPHAVAATPPRPAPSERVMLAVDEPDDTAATIPLGQSGLFAMMPERDAVIPPPPPTAKEQRR